MLEILTSESLTVRHGFFTRKGGASSGIFSGLNCGTGSSDQSEIVAINISLYKQLGYDPLRDLAPVTLVGTVPNILIANLAVPATTVKELIALAKARPGDLNYASAGSGSTPHIAAELFNHLAGVNVVRVLYKPRLSIRPFCMSVILSV